MAAKKVSALFDGSEWQRKIGIERIATTRKTSKESERMNPLKKPSEGRKGEPIPLVHLKTEEDAASSTSSEAAWDALS